MPWPQSGSSGPTLRKSQRPCGRLQNCLTRRLLAGGVPSPGVVVERSYIPSQPYEIAKNGKKTGGFAHILAYNSPKTPFFALKYLTRYTHETFFKEYINFKIFRNLSHCGVIPVQSFGSHIRPQPHGLGLRVYEIKQGVFSCTMQTQQEILSFFHQTTSLSPKRNESIKYLPGVIISIESFYTFLRACYNLQDSHSQTGLGVTLITLEPVIYV